MEGLSKAALIKSLSPRVMLSNHLLPKGTKMKVNLEDQGRQKVSFSFSQTKKPLQSSFFIPPSPDKSDPHAASSQSTSEKPGKSADSKTEQRQTPLVPVSKTETPQTPVPTATKVKMMHFKKQILNDSVTEEKQSVMPEEPHTSLFQNELPAPQSLISTCPSESAHTETSETRETSSLKKPAASSGKDGETSSSTEQDEKIHKRKTRSQSDSAPPGSESDGDSAQMSSSHKSVDSKSKTNSDSRSKDVRKSSSGSHAEEREKSFSKRSENYERSSSYSKSDRDSRHTSSRSSRSEKDRRRSRSRSRSRSRGSRTSSSHSRSDRTRSDRGSRSERSYYHESDRRSHRSSPRRDRRRSRSRTDRTRDSSDSEDDHRKTRSRTSDNSRSSNHSSSHKESKSSSYSKSEKTSKSVDSPHSSELDKRTQSSKSERSTKRLSDSDTLRKGSPDLDSSHRKSSSHHKSEANNKSSSSSSHTHSQTHEKRQKSSPSDSETDHKGKLQSSNRSSSSLENCKNSQKKSSRPESKQVPSRSSVKSSGQDRQSNDLFHSPGKAPSCATTTESFSQSSKEKSDSQPVGNENGNKDEKEVGSCGEDSQELSLKTEAKSCLETENNIASDVTYSESLKHVNSTLDNVSNVKDSLSSNDPTYVNSNASVVNLCSSNDSTMCNKDEDIFYCSTGPESVLHSVDKAVTEAVQQNTKPENVELDEAQAVSKESDTNLPVKSDSSCLQSENPPESLPTDVKKGSCSTRKSRWDIVGQDSSESENSQRTVCVESKLLNTVKKVISVKKIEFSKDNAQQDCDIKDDIQQEAETHSRLVRQTEISKQEVQSESTPVTFNCKDQSEPSQASTSNDHCDSKLSASQKSNTDQPLHINDKIQINSAATAQHSNEENSENKSKDSASKSKLSKRMSPSQDASGQSEASDSDNSEYDSDCDEAIKQLHSVVVVPKNSCLTMNTEERGPLNILQQQNAIAAEKHISEPPNQVSQQKKQPTTQTGISDSLSNSTSCQSQSNMIDSTSHSEASTSISTQPYTAGHTSSHASVTDSTPMRDNSKQCEQGHKQHDVSNRGDRTHMHYQQDHFSRADNINEKHEFNLGWDFSQPEQPTSTYQQPDSSHGPQLTNTKLSGSFSKGQEQEHRPSTASCIQQSQNMQTSRKNYLHANVIDQDPSGEIQPDSLTNDHDDFSGDKSSSCSKTAFEGSGPNTQGSSSFVQGHEISSNSRGSAVPDPSREDSFRPHRGRGPPKKRRPEIESDSDNEAEAGPAAKRDRQGDTEVAKETLVKSAADRPSLTLQDFQDANRWKEFAKSKKMPPYFDLIEENLYLTER